MENTWLTKFLVVVKFLFGLVSFPVVTLSRCLSVAFSVVLISSTGIRGAVFNLTISFSLAMVNIRVNVSKLCLEDTRIGGSWTLKKNKQMWNKRLRLRFSVQAHNFNTLTSLPSVTTRDENWPFVPLMTSSLLTKICMTYTQILQEEKTIPMIRETGINWA